MRVGIALIEGYSFSRDPEELGFAGLAASAKQSRNSVSTASFHPKRPAITPFFPLLIAAEHTSRVGLATGIAVSFPRSPMVTAQMAWDLQRLSGGRFSLGLGAPVKGRNSARYAAPWTSAPGPRMREYVQCLQAMFESSRIPPSRAGSRATTTASRCCRRSLHPSRSRTRRSRSISPP